VSTRRTDHYKEIPTVTATANNTRGTAIAGRTALVTGSNKGLGRALVQEALDRGAARVYATGRTIPNHTDPRVVPLILDVTNPDHIQAAVDQVAVLDVLVNNAGLGLYDDLSEAGIIEQHLKVNVFGPHALSRALLGQLRASRGAVVNIVSLASLASVPVMPAYSVSKAAALSLTQSQRALFGKEGVTVHAVLAGPIDTDMTHGLEIPKSSPGSVAAAILDGLERGDEEIFPDAMSGGLGTGWGEGLVKTLEKANAAMLG
jgi:NAD(P)-dependent dehydrogenase (short-subunit alcohol dehydrogenase family)